MNRMSFYHVQMAGETGTFRHKDWFSQDMYVEGGDFVPKNTETPKKKHDPDVIQSWLAGRLDDVDSSLEEVKKLYDELFRHRKELFELQKLFIRRKDIHLDSDDLVHLAEMAIEILNRVEILDDKKESALERYRAMRNNIPELSGSPKEKEPERE